jgi:hypothetical protein
MFEATQLRGFIYFLTDAKDRIVYIGQTDSVRRRLGEHIGTKVFSRAFAVPVPWILIDYVEGALIRHHQATNGYSGNTGCRAYDGRDNEFIEAVRTGKWDTLLDEFSSG